MPALSDIRCICKALLMVISEGVQMRGCSQKMSSKQRADLVKRQVSGTVELREVLLRVEVFMEGLKNYRLTRKLQLSKNMSLDVTRQTSTIDDVLHQKRHGQNEDFVKTKLSDNAFILEPSSVNFYAEKIVQSNPIEKAVPVQSQILIKENDKLNFTTTVKDQVKTALGNQSKERKVPSSQIGRLMSFGGLAAGLGIGAVAEIARRSLRFKGHNEDNTVSTLLNSNPFLSEANANRIVSTLCRVRGAALKLGQMISIQDNTMISPELQLIFERVRQSADFMPKWQMEKMLVDELGEGWHSKFSDFQFRPFAAASIGQVHFAVLPDGRDVAVKIQYPGVAKGIDSDINNLLAVMKVWDILPKGMYIENLMTVSRRELKWEVDYVREAECAMRYKKLLEEHKEFCVPEVIEDFSTKRILTTRMVYGIPVDQMAEKSIEVRNFIAESLLKLCLMELFNFRFMQTDPNWTNFLYNENERQIYLLDFGACREYSEDFIKNYLKVIKAAAENKREDVLKYSTVLGFLSGYESKVMMEAHIDAVMAIGEPFCKNEPYDFGYQQTTAKIHELVPIMLKHRLTPPPEESYSLHRKLSGIFLLCYKLKAKFNSRAIFDKVCKQYIEK